MRSSKKGILLFVCIAAGWVALLLLLDFLLYPCTYTRNDVHTVATQPREVLLLGTSCGKMNVDPDTLLRDRTWKGHNLCAGGEYPADAYYLLRLAVEKQGPKVVIYDVDPAYFTEEKEAGNNEVLFYHEFPAGSAKLAYFADTMPKRDFRAWLFPYYEYPITTVAKRIPDTVAKKATRDYSVESLKNRTQIYHENGFIERTPVEEDAFPAYKEFRFEQGESLRKNLEYLDRIIALCKEQDILFIPATMPLPDKLLNENPDFAEAAEYFASYFEERGIPYYNFNTEYYDLGPHDVSRFVDYEGHLNGEAARSFSSVLGTLWGYSFE